jgi:hypothetical protein
VWNLEEAEVVANVFAEHFQAASPAMTYAQSANASMEDPGIKPSPDSGESTYLSRGTWSTIHGRDIWVCSKTETWRAASVVSETSDAVLIHYVGYDRKYDEWLVRSSPRLCFSELKPTKLEVSSLLPTPSSARTSTASPVFTPDVERDREEGPKQELNGGEYEVAKQVHISCSLVRALALCPPQCSLRMGAKVWVVPRVA